MDYKYCQFKDKVPELGQGILVFFLYIIAHDGNIISIEAFFYDNDGRKNNLFSSLLFMLIVRLFKHFVTVHF